MKCKRKSSTVKGRRKRNSKKFNGYWQRYKARGKSFSSLCQLGGMVMRMTTVSYSRAQFFSHQYAAYLLYTTAEFCSITKPDRHI